MRSSTSSISMLPKDSVEPTAAYAWLELVISPTSPAGTKQQVCSRQTMCLSPGDKPRVGRQKRFANPSDVGFRNNPPRLLTTPSAARQPFVPCAQHGRTSQPACRRRYAGALVECAGSRTTAEAAFVQPMVGLDGRGLLSLPVPRAQTVFRLRLANRIPASTPPHGSPHPPARSQTRRPGSPRFFVAVRVQNLC